jgi:hypothetical protein
MKAQIIRNTLLFCTLALLFGCNNPNAFQCLTWIQGDVSEWGLMCKNMKTGEKKWVPIQEGHKYFAYSPDDQEVLRDWYKSGCENE